MKKLRLILLGIVALGFRCQPVYSQPHFEIALPGPGMPFMGDGPGMMLPLLLKGVDLTTEQEVQVQEIMTSQRESLRTLFKQLRTAHEEMANKLFTPGEVKTEDLAPRRSCSALAKSVNNS
jgi:Spy/CpxP family protein refolding chaperone